MIPDRLTYMEGRLKKLEKEVFKGSTSAGGSCTLAGTGEHYPDGGSAASDGGCPSSSGGSYASAGGCSTSKGIAYTALGVKMQ